MNKPDLTEHSGVALPLRPITIRDYVYQFLRERLGSGRFKLNQRIVEKDLVEQLSVSRTPVRDALARLSSEGFLISTKHGYRVPNISRDDIHNMFEMRTLLEPLAAMQAAKNPTKVGFSAMRRAIAREEEAHQNNDPNEFESAHLDFRSAWLSRIKNPLLLEAIGKSLITLQLIRHLAMKKGEIRVHIVDSHRGLLRNIEEKHAERAYEFQKERVLEFHELMLHYVAEKLGSD